MTITTSSSPGISQRTNVFAAREMLKHAAPVIVLELFEGLAHAITGSRE